MARHSPRMAAFDHVSIIALKTFIAVAEAQSFSSAARQLRLSASGVTHNILALERSVQVALFHRTTRRVAITEAGERFYRRCKAVVREIDQALSAVASDGARRAHLRVTSPPSFASAALAPNLASFLARHPNLSIDLMVTSGMPNMISERIDLTFVLREELDSKLPHIRIGPSGRAFCASPKYLAEHGVPATPAELARHRCLANMLGGTSERWTVKLGRTRKQIQVNAQFMADNGDVLRRACVDGAGIGNFYRFHVRASLEQGELAEVLSAYQPNSNFVYAVTPHREMVLPQVQLFVDYVRSIVAGPPFVAAASAA
jgi:DNA-binding transcriptional LysR family regulator